CSWPCGSPFLASSSSGFSCLNPRGWPTAGGSSRPTSTRGLSGTRFSPPRRKRAGPGQGRPRGDSACGPRPLGRRAGTGSGGRRTPSRKGMQNMRQAWLVVLLALALLAAPAAAQDVPTIKVGAIVTYTGPTSDVGAHYGDGVRDYFRWLAEEHGGIVETGFGPARVELVWTDDQYNPQVTLTALRRFISEENIIGVITWGTGSNLAIMDELNRAQVPALSASRS